jgi:hypothetical protein
MTDMVSGNIALSHTEIKDTTSETHGYLINTYSLDTDVPYCCKFHYYFHCEFPNGAVRLHFMDLRLMVANPVHNLYTDRANIFARRPLNGQTSTTCPRQG